MNKHRHAHAVTTNSFTIINQVGTDLLKFDGIWMLFSLLRRGFCFLKNRGKEGKAEKRERRKKGKGGKTGKAEKAREKGKSEESFCQISVEIWQKLSISDSTQPECRLSFSWTGTPRSRETAHRKLFKLFENGRQRICRGR